MLHFHNLHELKKHHYWKPVLDLTAILFNINWKVMILFSTVTFYLPKNSILFQLMNFGNFGKYITVKIYGPKYEDGEWKIRTNRELEEVNKGENIVKWIKGQRISWLGYLERMEEDRMPKKIFTQELEGMR